MLAREGTRTHPPAEALDFLPTISPHCVRSCPFPSPPLICESQTPEERRRGFFSAPNLVSVYLWAQIGVMVFPP